MVCKVQSEVVSPFASVPAMAEFDLKPRTFHPLDPTQSPHGGFAAS